MGMRIWRARRGVLGAALLLAVGALSALWAAGPAGATLPGGNGKIVYANGGIWVAGSGGENPARLTSSIMDADPSWSPDGDEIVFSRSYEAEMPRVYCVDADGVLGEVRLIGMDTPETRDPDEEIEPFGPEASAYAVSRLSGVDIELEFDQERTDQYGRLLAYVYPAGGEMFNVDLVEQGYAQARRTLTLRTPGTRTASRRRKTRPGARGSVSGGSPKASNASSRTEATASARARRGVSSRHRPSLTPLLSNRAGTWTAPTSPASCRPRKHWTMIPATRTAWTRTVTALPAKARPVAEEMAGPLQRRRRRLPRPRVRPHRRPPRLAPVGVPYLLRVGSARPAPPLKATRLPVSTTCQTAPTMTRRKPRNVLLRRRRPRPRGIEPPNYDRG